MGAGARSGAQAHWTCESRKRNERKQGAEAVAIRIKYWLPGIAFGLLVSTFGNIGVAAAPISCTNAEVLGRVVEASYKELPETPGYLNLTALWTLRVKVERVVRGRIREEFITVSVVSDPAIAKGVQLDFQLKRVSPGHYEWKQFERECAN